MRFSSSFTTFALGAFLLNALAVPVTHDGTTKAVDAVLPPSVSMPDVPALAVVPPGDTHALDTTLLPRARSRSSRSRSRARPKKTRKSKKKTTTKKRPGKGRKKTKKTKKGKDKKKPWEEPVPSEREITKKCKVPRNRAIFWSGVWKQTEAYAKQHNLIHDELAYPRGYTLKYMRKNGKAYNERKNQLFAKRFSKVFARKSTGIVYVMTPWKDGPKAGRVFAADEWPILKKSMDAGRVTKVIQVNPDNFEESRIYKPERYGLSKREGVARRGVDFDVDLENVPWDVDLDALEEAWKREAEKA